MSNGEQRGITARKACMHNSILNTPSRYYYIRRKLKILNIKEVLRLKLGICYLKIEKPECHAFNVTNDINFKSIVRSLISIEHISIYTTRHSIHFRTNGIISIIL
jgi:hypothetical protein